MRSNKLRRFLSTLLTLLLATTLLTVVDGRSPAAAATTDKCDGTSTQNTTKVTASHGKIFYIDSVKSQNVDASYVSYRIENTAATPKDNVWVKLDSFSGGVVQLANPMDAAQSIGSIPATSVKPAFFMVMARISSNLAQSHIVHVYTGNPSTAGAREIYSCTFAFTKVSETISAQANKVTNVASDVAISNLTTIGSKVVLTVEGNTGTLGQGTSVDGSMIWFSPSARSNFPTQSLRLESTSIDVATNKGLTQNKQTFTNQLQIKGLTTNTKYYYSAKYTFRIIGRAATTTTLLPITQVSSGTQVKHSDVTATNSSLTINTTSLATNAEVSKSVAMSVDTTGGSTKLNYTISLKNTGAAGSPAVVFDQVVDTPSAGLSYVTGTAQFNGAATSPPSISTIDSSKLIFPGPFEVSANSTKTLTYQMQVNSCASDTFVNTAEATIGGTSIGVSATALSLVTAKYTCGNSSLTSNTVTTQTLLPEVFTSPASSVTSPATSADFGSAVLNGLVDPNGATGQGKDIYFDWGTSSNLAGSTAVRLANPTTNSTTAYAVSTTLSSLNPGTYYFRVRVDSYYGEILSFNILPAPAPPTATTGTVTSMTVGASSTDATLAGQVSPNQITNGLQVKFEYVRDNSSTPGTCSGFTNTPTSSGFLTVETDTTPVVAQYLGANPIDVELALTGLTNSVYYCFRVVGYYNSTTATYDQTVAGSWKPFRTIVKVTQTITMSTPATQTFGVSPFNLTTFTTTATGLTVSLTSNDTSICEISASGRITIKGAGICSISGSEPGNDNYYPADPVTITFIVDKKPVTVTAPTQDVVYGSSVPTISPSYSNDFVSPDTSSVISGQTCSTSYTATSTAGTTQTTSCSGGNAANYSFTYVNGAITVTKRPVTVTASNASVQYGSSAPTITPSYSNDFVNGQNSSVVSGTSCTSAYTVLSSVNSTPSTSCSGATATNYSFSYVDGSVTITKRPVAVTASNASVQYGSSAPTITPSYSNDFVNGQNSSVVSGINCSSTYTTTSPVGATPTTSCSGATATNYSFTYNSGSVSIIQRPVTVTASSESVHYGDSVPVVTPSYSGLANSEGSSVFSRQPTCSTAYTITSAAGTTPSTSCTGATATNYSFSYTSGSITVQKRPIVVTASSPSSITEGDPVPSITALYEDNFVNSQTYSTLNLSPTCTTTYLTNSPAGTYETTCSMSDTVNYTFTFRKGSLTVTIAGAPTVDPVLSTTSISSPISVQPNANAKNGKSIVSNSACLIDPLDSVCKKSVTVDKGTFDVDANGKVTFTPNRSGIGSVPTIKYQVKDSADVAAQNDVNITITRGNRSLTLNPPAQTNLTWSATPTATVTATTADDNDNTVDHGKKHFSVNPADSAICSVDPTTGVVTFAQLGDCRVEGSIDEGTRFNSAVGRAANGDSYVTISMARGNRTLTLNPPAQTSLTWAATPPTATVTATTADDNDNTVAHGKKSFAINAADSAICSVNADTGVVTFLKAGDCRVTGSIAQGERFNAADGKTSGNADHVTISMARADRTLTATTNGTNGVLWGTSGRSISATASADDDVDSKSYTSADPTICSVDGAGNLTLHKPGTCSLIADIVQGAKYNAKTSNSVSFTIAKKDHSISGMSDKSANTSDGSVSMAVTLSSGQTPTYAITGTNSANCSVDANGTVTFTSAGDCEVTASHSGNDYWNSATQVKKKITVTGSTVSKRNRNLTPVRTGGNATPARVGTTGKVTPDLSEGTGSPTLIAGPSSVCTLAADGTLTFLAEGICKIEGTDPGNGTYNASSGILEIKVVKKSPTLNLTANPITIRVTGKSVLSLTGTYGRGAVKYSVIGGNNNCSIADDEVTGLRSGSCRINATVEADNEYDSSTSNTIAISVIGSLTPSPSAGPTRTAVPTPSAAPAPTIRPSLELPIPFASSVTSLSNPLQREPATNTVNIDGKVVPASQAPIDASAASRTVSDLASEALGGFKPGAGLTIEVIGARTTGQFIVTPGVKADPIAVAAALQESSTRTSTNFAKLEKATSVSQPANEQIIGGQVTTDAQDLFSASDLAKPITVGQLGVKSDAKWIKVDASVNTYKPGSVVYLAVTTQPIIFGAAVVDALGNADFSGFLPVDALPGGGHNIRIVGLRQLDGVTTDGNGEVVLSDSTLTEIQKFDEGTKSTVKVMGENAAGGKNLVVREIPLSKFKPWWTLWFVAWTALLLVAARRFRKINTKQERLVATAIVGLSTLPALVLGWVTATYEIMGIGSAICLVGIMLIRFTPVAKERQRRGQVSITPASSFQ